MVNRQESERGRVVIGTDPHKRSVTIEVMDPDEGVHGGGRFDTDVVGYKAMLASVKKWPDRRAAGAAADPGRPTRALGEDHTRMISQRHLLLLELIPGGAKKDLSAAEAKKLLASVRPRDVVGKTRRRVAAELIGDLVRRYARTKAPPTESCPNWSHKPAPR